VGLTLRRGRLCSHRVAGRWWYSRDSSVHHYSSRWRDIVINMDMPDPMMMMMMGYMMVNMSMVMVPMVMMMSHVMGYVCSVCSMLCLVMLSISFGLQ